jgi:hypothetical protein
VGEEVGEDEGLVGKKGEECSVSSSIAFLAVFEAS